MEGERTGPGETLVERSREESESPAPDDNDLEPPPAQADGQDLPGEQPQELLLLLPVPGLLGQETNLLHPLLLLLPLRQGGGRYLHGPDLQEQGGALLHRQQGPEGEGGGDLRAPAGLHPAQTQLLETVLCQCLLVVQVFLIGD